MSYSLVDNSNLPLDLKLNNLFNEKNDGFFIELGAFDGLYQSNTAFFEKHKKWKGILIEPSKNMFEKCVKNRPNSKVYNFACVSDEYYKNNKYIKGDFTGGMMSSVDGKRTNNKKLVSVEANTLTNILDSYGNIKEIDILSLDTEGYELNILKGLDFTKYKPKYILIEIYKKDFDEIKKYLLNLNYVLHSNFSNYNKKDNPLWDGTHNDYLFLNSTLV